MGAWSTNSFGNDTACDWTYGLEDTTDLALVRETIQKVIDAGKEYLEAPDSEEAIAAVEVIARLKGNSGERNSYTETVDNWVTENSQQVSPDLDALASQALDRILQDPSELLDLWKESDKFEEWRSSIVDLKRRVTG